MENPDKLFVRIEGDGDDRIILAFETMAEAVEGDGPTVVSIYSWRDQTTAYKETKTR